MNLFAKQQAGLPYADFLQRYGTDAHQARWKSCHDQVVLTPAQQSLLASFKRKTPILCLAGAWCGDCATQCPIFERFAQLAPCLQVRFLDRDEAADVQQALQINGGNRVPVLVFFSEDGHEVSRFGERTLAKYRSLLQAMSGEGCATGIGADPLLAAVTQDWLNEFERVECILRLSPRLRKLNGD